MVTLTIRNSYSIIQGLDIALMRALKSVLCYEEKTYSSSRGYGVKIRPLISSTGVFPSGLLSLAQEWLKFKCVPYQQADLRIAPTGQPGLFKLNLGGVSPYQDQIKAAKVAAAANRGTVSMCTGFGKSLTIALLIDKLQVKTLIVVPNLALKSQLTRSIKEWFGDTKHITVENIDSKKLLNSNDYDCLIIDEAHHVAAFTYRKLNKTAWKDIFHRYFFTATPFRSKAGEDILMESVSGEVIYTVDYHKAVELKAIVPLEAYVIDLPKIPVEGITWASVYSELVVNNEHRNALITKLLLSFTKERRSALCLVKELKHGTALSHGGAFPFANGIDEESQDMIDSFSSKASGCLIGTVGVMSEGVDTKPCEFVIIAGLGKSKSQFMQSCGRAVRKYPGKQSAKVILFRDPSHRWTLQHFKEQCKVLLDVYGVVPDRLEVSYE